MNIYDTMGKFENFEAFQHANISRNSMPLKYNPYTLYVKNINVLLFPFMFYSNKPVTMRVLNALRQDIIDVASLNSFKKKLKIPIDIFSEIFLNDLTGEGQILHVRFRLECSSLNQLA